MQILVQLIGLVLSVVGVLVLAVPELFRGSMGWWKEGGRLRVAGLLKAVIGAVLIAAASATRWPLVVSALGAGMVLAGLAGVVAGDRLEPLLDWWAGRPASVLRLWGLATAAIGVLLVFASR